MEEIGTCLATKLAECLWDPISRRARYLFCFNEYGGVVEKIKEELLVTLADVNIRKEEAHRKTEEIMPSVKKWLDDVNAILEDVQKLQQEVGEGGKKCLNVSLKYSLAKEMDDKAKQMKDLKKNSRFESFSQPIPPPNISDQFSSKDVMDFKSRESIFNSLFEAIKDGKNNMVGLCGIGGSGKTTLAIEVGKKIERLKLFDKVVKVVVSRPLNVRNIQEEIKGKTGLKFEENTESTIAQRLLIGLKSMKILLILDDVWSDLNLQEIGIPINENCRVLLTTRLRDVCVYMGCEENFELPLLIEEEAWDLLKMHANITHDSLNEFVGVGKKIVDECKGLPIAIVTVGRALRGRGIVEWKSALWRLRQSLPLDIEESSKGPYACLKLSYDYLPSLAKQLFLLCSMFPEDHQIHREDLIRFAKGTLEFEGIVYTIEDARREILVSINRLLDSCLLMHTNEQACVKRHDLVGDVALWIARKQHQAILVDSHAVSRMLAENGSLKETKVISLWNLEGNFRQSNQLHCPTLEVLLLHPEGFIEDLGGIEELKILVLVTSSFQWEGCQLGWHTQIQWSMPQSIVSSLINLHTLCFKGIALGDISFLGQLKGLEILDLRGSQFGELPIGIVDMKKLKLLDVFRCEIERSPLEVIGRCEQLEELYFWNKKFVIPENFSLSMLKRYVIYDTTSLEFPPLLEYFDVHCIEEVRALCIQGFKVSVSHSSMKDLVFGANCLWLENCRWDLNDINFEIKHLAISCCVEKRFIVDNRSTNILQPGQVFSHLISLRLRKMNNLERVFQDSSITCSLPMLQELFLERCPELGTCIFSHATVTSLPKLRKLEIEYCDKLKWLFSYSLASQCPSLEELRIRDCPKLERLTNEEDEHDDCPLHQRESLQDYPYVSVISTKFVLNHCTFEIIIHVDAFAEKNVVS
ncbi:disease resistance protein At4g27190-like [Neltuma alba]|uniref:disease resistance protein At4g27190-like n=1 Tax=Neltuma alba TaxID=207710 RepID=UPI0010A512B0|nr:disease resistance protein At4g27190-like [Prosopis alba]